MSDPMHPGVACVVCNQLIPPQGSGMHQKKCINEVEIQLHKAREEEEQLAKRIKDNERDHKRRKYAQSKDTESEDVISHRIYDVANGNGEVGELEDHQPDVIAGSLAPEDTESQHAFSPGVGDLLADFDAPNGAAAVMDVVEFALQDVEIVPHGGPDATTNHSDSEFDYDDLDNQDVSDSATLSMLNATADGVPVRRPLFEHDSEPADNIDRDVHTLGHDLDIPGNAGWEELRRRATTLGVTVEEAQRLRPGDVKRVYHPKSGKRYEIISADDFGKPVPVDMESFVATETHTGFATRDDFELAEFMLDATLNKQLIRRLFKIINKIADGKSTIRMRSLEELESAWETASEIETAFTKTTVNVPYKNDTRPFEVHVRSTWDHVLKQLRNPLLAPYIHYDAVRDYRFNGTCFNRFVTEPYTADHIWKVQDALEGNRKPIILIVYSDVAKFSSFGTQKARPFIVSIGNIDSAVRHGKGLGSATVVGWLPIVPKDPEEEGKTGWANFKVNVYHRSVEVVLESVTEPSHTGYTSRCGDGNIHFLNPTIAIADSDYGELVDVTCNRGLGGRRPCPVCLIMHDSLKSILLEYPRRDWRMEKLAVTGWYRTKARRETELSELGIRPVKNAFWEIGYSDINRAVSFDRLHAYSLGLFGEHLFGLWKVVLEGYGRPGTVAVDNMYVFPRGSSWPLLCAVYSEQAVSVSSMPRWRKIHHFTSITTMKFNDGSKFEDICKIILLASHNIIAADLDPKGYQLLKTIRIFQVLDMYMSYELHTEESLTAFHNTLQAWNSAIEALSAHFPDKEWNFIKIHSHVHAPFDIINKGVAKHLSTKPFESMHGPLRRLYLRLTNFRNPAGQILHHEHHQLCSNTIRACHDALDDYYRQDPDEEPASDISWMFGHVYLGSRSAQTWHELEAAHVGDRTFAGYRAMCEALVSQQRTEHMRAKLGIDGYWPVRLSSEREMWESCFLRVKYRSLITWTDEEDLLRCSPDFYNQARYDGIIYRTNDGIENFGILAHVSAHDIEGSRYGLALIRPLDGDIGELRSKDSDLGLFRVHSRPEESCTVIPLTSIVRGAMIMKDELSGDHSEYYVVDMLDPDMFERVKMYSAWRNAMSPRV